MKIIGQGLVGIFLLVASGTGNAYELGTHGRLTYEAYKRSVLSDVQVLSDWGLENGKNPFGEFYYDVSGATVNERSRQLFEQQADRMPRGAEPLSLEGWLMRGAIREDDIPWPIGSNPQDDPYGNIWRVFNHFYDPIYNRPLTVLTGLGETAPNWAVGSANALTASPAPNTGRRNHYTVFDARESMYRALTGRDVSGNPVAAIEAERNKYWATTFRALGDAVHLLQDMGQPQHTRNEAHCGASFSIPVPACGHKSVYEAYIEARATGDVFATPGGTSVSANGLRFDGYPTPQFNNYTSFFTTRHLDAGEFDRRGLADYSNRGFFTAGKNFGHGEYLYPPSNPSFYIPETLSTDWVGNPLPSGATVTMLNGMVSDTVEPSKSQMARLTTHGLWDQFLESKGFWPSYTLNRYNYDAMADLLTPRAVGYSAGMINYFFRGKIDFVPDPTNAGNYIIKNLGPEDMKGTFTLYYDAADGKRYPVAGAVPDKTWADIAITKGGQADNLSFTPPTDPAPKSPGEYMLVFNGDMGEEKAIPGTTLGAVAAKHVSAYTGVLYLAGKTNAGQLVYFRTDRSGTRLISPEEFNPFVFDQPVGNGSYVPRLDLFKQVRFSGVNSYEVIAVSVQSAASGYPEFRPYVRDDVTKVWARVSAPGVAWKAVSNDPAIGEFTFFATSYDLDRLKLRYSRTYINGSGIKVSDSGELQLPAGPIAWINGYRSFMTAKLVVSPDGKNIFGLLASDGDAGYIAYRLDLVLGAVPSAILTTTDTWRREFNQTTSPKTLVVVGKFTTVIPAECNQGSAPYTGDITRWQEEDIQRLTVQRLVPIGYFSGSLATYRIMENVLFQNKVDITNGNIGISTGCAQNWIYSTYSGYQIHSADFSNTFNFNDGIIPWPIRFLTGENYTVSYFYEGYAPAPAPTFQSFESAYNRQKIINRAIGPSYRNVVMTNYETNPLNQEFRGMQLDQGYVADASPIGEVFFATPDLRVVIHEPQLGGMKTVEIPAQVTKLIAAIWL